MDNLEIRKMQPQEATETRKLATKAFNGIERFLISKPKDAIVAIMDGKIVGGIIMTYTCSKAHKIGYYDGAFIHPDYQGRGIGSKLYAAAKEYLWKQGCTAQAAFVKDDNVASWKLFLSNGFSRMSFFGGLKALGCATMLKYYFTTPFFAASGMEFYLAIREGQLQSKAENTWKNIFLYLFVNALLFLSGWVGLQKWTGIDRDYPMYLAAYLTLLTSGVVCAYIGTLFSKREWSFRLNSGGAVLSGLFYFLGGIYPMIGNWYPKAYENTKKFKRDMGLVALWDWIALLLITIVACRYAKSHIYVSHLRQLGVLLLLYKIIPVYPFEALGGGRVYRWNKWLFMAMAVGSVAVMLFGGSIVK